MAAMMHNSTDRIVLLIVYIEEMQIIFDLHG